MSAAYTSRVRDGQNARSFGHDLLNIHVFVFSTVIFPVATVAHSFGGKSFPHLSTDNDPSISPPCFPKV